jgi:hypothetical protein
MPTPAQNLAPQILDQISSDNHTVWTANDFLHLGSRAAVDKALQRLTASGQIRRIDRGLYDRHQVNRLTGKARAPDPSGILDAIARRDQTRLLIDGITAANDLGLTTAVPARINVLSDARLRPIILGRQEIIFKQAAPSRLYWAGRPAMRVVQSLHWLHDVLDTKNPSTLARLRSILADPTHGPTIRQDLHEGLSAMPIWMQDIVRQLLHEGEGIPRLKAKKQPSTSSRNGARAKKRTKTPSSRTTVKRPSEAAHRGRDAKGA